MHEYLLSFYSLTYQFLIKQVGHNQSAINLPLGLLAYH